MYHIHNPHTHTYTYMCVLYMYTHTMLYTQTSHPHTLTLTRASVAGMAGTVLAVPHFGCLTISGRGLAIQSGESGTHVVALN